MSAAEDLEPDAARDDGSASGEVDTPWGSLTTALDGTILTVNSRFAGWSGRTAEALRRSVRWKDLLAPASRILHETHFIPVLEAQRVANEIAFDLLRPDGSRFPVLVCALRQRLGAGAAPGGAPNDPVATTTLTVFDARETRRFEQALRKARREAEAATEAVSAANRQLRAQHEQLRVTLRSIADAVVTIDPHGRITSMNPTAEQLAGVALAQAAGMPVSALGRLTDPQSGAPISAARLFRQRAGHADRSALLTRHDGTQRHVDGSVATIRDEDGRITGTVLVCRDVTRARASALQLAFEASHDHLTGLLNRREFERRIQQAAASERSLQAPDLLLYLDLDQFKIINDTAGHTAGDQALVQVAGIIREGLRQTDALARLGGDEFGALLHQCAFEHGMQIADELRRRLEESRFVWCGRVYGLTASIGLAALSREECAAGNALAGADMACIAAKESGRNRVQRFDAADAQAQSRRDEMSWVSRILRGLDEDRFLLHFQPIVRVDGKAEARRRGELLLRLREDDGSIIAPGKFIVAAERFQQMGQVDRWVVRRAFAWLDSVGGDVQASINLSGQSFGDEGFLDYVIEQLGRHGFAPSCVCFEITETAAIADLASAQRFIQSLRSRGVRFALDDFGAGLSSFRYLKTLAVDYVKIDGSFVRAMIGDAVNREIVQSIHRVARCCRLQTVAEWVEDAEVRVALARIGVDYAQGWHIDRPQPIQDGQLPMCVVRESASESPADEACIQGTSGE